MGAKEDTPLGQQNFFRFLSKVDTYLQEQTLGVTRKSPSHPKVTNHTFRSLEPFEFAVKEDGNDYATGVGRAA